MQSRCCCPPESASAESCSRSLTSSQIAAARRLSSTRACSSDRLAVNRLMRSPWIRSGPRGGRGRRRGFGLGEEGTDLPAQFILDHVDPPPGVEHPEAVLVGHRRILFQQRLLIAAETVV